jgi:NADH-quinone oxidoreductase subunit N
VVFAAVASLTVGNLGAVTQSSAKRLLAWSSIAHAGYLLLGLVAGNRTGIEALLFYLLVYTLMTAGAFVLVAGLEREGVTDFRGLLHRHPGTAMLLLVLLLSLAGLPPTAGFVAKYLVFLSLIQAKLYWLAVVGGLYVAVSLYYYFRLVREMVMPAGDEPVVLNMSTGWRAAVGLGALLSLALGLQPENFLAWARGALE